MQAVKKFRSYVWFVLGPTIQAVKNFRSYVWFVLGPTIIILIIDVFFLSFSIYQSIYQLFCENSIYQILYEKSVVAIILYVLAILAIIWQFINVLVTYLKPLVKREKRGCQLKDIIENDERNIPNRNINVDLVLLEKYGYSLNEKLCVLENSKVSKILEQNERSINLSDVEDRQKKTKEYIKQYRCILLKFLNYKWHDVKHNGGNFINDEKIRFLSELYEDRGNLYWKVTKGNYYNGYLTNVIFNKFIGDPDSIYPPFNSTNTVIRCLGDSVFSDHIGVSTILLTEDNIFIYCLQHGKAAQFPNKYMPSGSGSLDYCELHENEDLHSLIVRGAERELYEETSLGQLFKKGKNRETIKIETTILSFYRDLERAGKPEFCCVSRINKNIEFIKSELIKEEKEIANIEYVDCNDEGKWNKIYPQASLSLKMNYKALQEFLKRKVK
ncbi:MAG: hypothetical protein J6K01_02420 [Paludibacteraceae bacterium]|nr:hypothetical protein [Paludibacteraceae bacterium]